MCVCTQCKRTELKVNLDEVCIKSGDCMLLEYSITSVCVSVLLVPWPSDCLDFDHLQYARRRRGKAWSILSCEGRQCLPR